MGGNYVMVTLCLGVALLGNVREANAAAVADFDEPVVASRSGNGPEISGSSDGKQAWLAARYKDLIVRKTTTRVDRSLTIDLRYRTDFVSIGIDAQAQVAVSRNGRRIAVSSAEALEAVQHLLAGSDAVFGARVLLSEREAVSDLKAPEMSLLSAAAFVASIVGDTNAPLRLATRFVERHRGIFRSVRDETCWAEYSGEAGAAWDDLQNCMGEANEEDSFFSGAYRRVACNAVWAMRAESAWFEYLNCLSLSSIAK